MVYYGLLMIEAGDESLEGLKLLARKMHQRTHFGETMIDLRIRYAFENIDLKRVGFTPSDLALISRLSNDDTKAAGFKGAHRFRFIGRVSRGISEVATMPPRDMDQLSFAQLVDGQLSVAYTYDRAWALARPKAAQSARKLAGMQNLPILEFYTKLYDCQNIEDLAKLMGVDIKITPSAPQG